MPFSICKECFRKVKNYFSYYIKLIGIILGIVNIFPFSYTEYSICFTDIWQLSILHSETAKEEKMTFKGAYAKQKDPSTS